MYRWLLCWRYLKTRYIALASVISVTLGVATLIVVNSVMDGFTTEMQDRMHGILSDVILESHATNGLPDHEAIQQRIRQVVGDDLEGMTTVVHVPAMVTIEQLGSEPITRQINLIGIDTDSYANVSDFSKYLMHPENQKQISFALKEDGYAPDRSGFPESGWIHRRRTAAARKRMLQLQLEYELEKKEHEFLQGLERQNNDYLKSLVDSVGVMAPRDLPLGDLSTLDASTTETADATDNAPDTSDDGTSDGLVANDSERGAEEAMASEAAGSTSHLSDAPLAPYTNPTSDSPLPTPPPKYASSGSSDHFATEQSGLGSTSAHDTNASPLGGPRVDAVATRPEDQARVFDAEHEQHDGIVLGISIGSTRYRDS
ncbi:MAG: hypothetical protein KDA72_03550, partial [Planctomycetales bacterium]|nr:hypothetical protein [Planctomycetales bacterium]